MIFGSSKSVYIVENNTFVFMQWSFHVPTVFVREKVYPSIRQEFPFVFPLPLVGGFPCSKLWVYGIGTRSCIVPLPNAQLGIGRYEWLASRSFSIFGLLSEVPFSGIF